MHRNESLIVNEDHKILRKHNVIITPHIAYDTKEALMRITETTVDNINILLKERKRIVLIKLLKNLIQPQIPSTIPIISKIIYNQTK